MIILVIICIITIVFLVFLYSSPENSPKPNIPKKIKNKDYSNNRIHLAHVYVKNEDYKGFKLLMFSNYIAPENIYIHNYQIKDYDEVPKLLNTLHSWNMKYFIGFNDSEMVKRSMDFFESHKEDTIMISCGNEINFPNLPKNIWNMKIVNQNQENECYNGNVLEGQFAKDINTVNLYDSITIMKELCEGNKRNIKEIETNGLNGKIKFDNNSHFRIKI